MVTALSVKTICDHYKKHRQLNIVFCVCFLCCFLWRSKRSHSYCRSF